MSGMPRLAQDEARGEVAGHAQAAGARRASPARRCRRATATRARAAATRGGVLEELRRRLAEHAEELLPIAGLLLDELVVLEHELLGLDEDRLARGRDLVHDAPDPAP